MNKILNQIKRVLALILNDDYRFNCNEYERGRQEVAKQIADIIDPINQDNITPNNNIDEGEILYKFKSPAKPTSMFGKKGYVLELKNNYDSLVLGSIPWDDDFTNTNYEITVRKIGNIENNNQNENHNQEKKPLQRAKKQKDQVQDIYQYYMNFVAQKPIEPRFAMPDIDMAIDEPLQ